MRTYLLAVLALAVLLAWIVADPPTAHADGRTVLAAVITTAALGYYATTTHPER